MQEKAVIFDLDGTMWDSVEIICEAWNSVFEKTLGMDFKVTQADIRGLMGMTTWEISSVLFPQLSEEERGKIMDACCGAEDSFLREHGAILYDRLEETLDILSGKYGLYIVSNCQDGYIQAFLYAHQLGKYFTDIEMSGRTGKPKGENIRLLMERNGITKAVYVGDTAGDQKAAAQAGIPFVYASYGFGDVKDPDYTIKAFAELPPCMETVFEK